MGVRSTSLREKVPRSEGKTGITEERITLGAGQNEFSLLLADGRLLNLTRSLYA